MFPKKSSTRRNIYGSSSVPAWLIFFIAVALVFGGYYLWLGLRTFINESITITATTIVLTTTPQEQIQGNNRAVLPNPTNTPLPKCQDFRVIAQPAAILRAGPSQDTPVEDSISIDETLCVLLREGDTDWYLVDTNPLTRRIESAYVRDDLVEAVNPTPTPTETFTPAPTVTPTPTETPSTTPTPPAGPAQIPNTITRLASLTPVSTPTIALRGI